MVQHKHHLLMWSTVTLGRDFHTGQINPSLSDINLESRWRKLQIIAGKFFDSSLKIAKSSSASVLCASCLPLTFLPPLLLQTGINHQPWISLAKLEGLADTDVPKNLCSSKMVLIALPKAGLTFWGCWAVWREGPRASELRERRERRERSWNYIIHTISAQLPAARGQNTGKMLQWEQRKMSLNGALNRSSDRL